MEKIKKYPIMKDGGMKNWLTRGGEETWTDPAKRKDELHRSKFAVLAVGGTIASC